MATKPKSGPKDSKLGTSGISPACWALVQEMLRGVPPVKVNPARRAL